MVNFTSSPQAALSWLTWAAHAQRWLQHTTYLSYHPTGTATARAFAWAPHLSALCTPTPRAASCSKVFLRTGVEVCKCFSSVIFRKVVVSRLNSQGLNKVLLQHINIKWENCSLPQSLPSKCSSISHKSLHSLSDVWWQVFHFKIHKSHSSFPLDSHSTVDFILKVQQN